MKKSPQQWVETIEQQQNGSLTIKKFCQQENISTSGFYKHKKLMVNRKRLAKDIYHQTLSSINLHSTAAGLLY
jgi:hypothetical protein